MINVIVADDQMLVRSGIAMILDAAEDIAVIAQADDGNHAVSLAEQHRPDVVLMDVRMPHLDGIAATRQLRATMTPPPKVLMLTTFDSDENVYNALQAGASGFLLKTAPPARLVDAVRCIHAGEALLAPTITRRLIETQLRRPPPGRAPDDTLDALTDREREVLKLIAEGASNHEIATALVISEATVKTHVNRILAKLHLRDRVHAVITAYRTGLVQIEHDS